MWQPVETFGLRRVLAVVTMIAAAFMMFRIGFAAESAELALAAIGMGALTVALAVGLLTINRPSRILAGGLFIFLFWGVIFGGGAALVYVIFAAPQANAPTSSG